MTDVTAQYDAYPYPERDPADEDTRLLSGSPSNLREIDHFLFAGERDWSDPLRVLVAGGGTGDGLVQIAQGLAEVGTPAEIHYLDLSRSARRIAEARIARRGLTSVNFHSMTLLDAPDLGRFDYIDCCGVLHHLPDPDAGFSALRAALAPGGGMGFMVYAPYGRSGVYPLQEAFGALLAGLDPAERLRKAREIFARVPDGHPFKRNPHLVDHRQSDAGFYDLLLHGQDRAYGVHDLLGALDRGGWRLLGFAMSGLYELSAYADAPSGLGSAASMALAERLDGTIKTHVGYAVASQDTRTLPDGRPWAAARRLVPHLKGDARALAARVAEGRAVTATVGGAARRLDLPKGCAPLIGGIDGRRTTGEIAKQAKLEPKRAAAAWARVEAALVPWGLLLYSRLGRAGQGSKR